MSYLTEPQPCDPWCKPKQKFNNLGGYGSYPALEAIHANDKLSRYMHHTDSRPCCPFTNSRLEYIQKHHIPSKPLPAACESACHPRRTRSSLKNQENPLDAVSAPLANAACWSVNNAGTDFNSFLTDVSKMNPAGNDTDLKKACFEDPINETNCLKFINTNYGKYGGLLGPVPTGGTPPYLKNNSGTYIYPGDSGNTTELLTSFGLPNRGASSDVKDGKWVITDPASKTASLTLGDTGRNPFYCSGKGFCDTAFKVCTCDDGYQPGDGTCKPMPQQGYNCMQTFSTANGITRQCVPKEATDSAAAAYKTKADCSAACNAYMFNPSAGNNATSCDKASQYDWCGTCELPYQSCDETCRDSFGRPNYMLGAGAVGRFGEAASMPVNGIHTQWSGADHSPCYLVEDGATCACGPKVPRTADKVFSCMEEGNFWCYNDGNCYEHGSGPGNDACPGQKDCVSNTGGCKCTDPSDTSCGNTPSKPYRI